MWKWISLVSVLALLGGGGCVTHRPLWDVLQPVELGQRTLEGGETEVYRLEGWTPEGDLQLLVETQTERERPRLGFQVRELEVQVGDGLIQRCLSVSRVEWRSPAEAAGLLVDDILVSVEGTEVYSESQLGTLIDTTLSPGEAVRLTIRRERGRDIEVRECRILSEVEPYTHVSRRVVPLKGVSAPDRSYSGIVLGTLPLPWSDHVFGESEPILLIGNVSEGSPAYLAGLRAGDRVVSVAGQTYVDADELSSFLSRVGPKKETVEFEVVRDPGGVFRTDVKLRDFNRKTEIHVPLLFKVESDREVTHWSLGPFGLLMEYEGRYLSNRRSRATNYHRQFDFLFNLLELEFWPDGYDAELLWLIEFGSR